MLKLELREYNIFYDVTEVPCANDFCVCHEGNYFTDKSESIKDGGTG
jgi:hypothetical protein